MVFGERQLRVDGVDVAALRVGPSHHVAGSGIVLHVVDSRTDIDQRLEHRMRGHILDALAVDVDLASVANAVAILLAGTDHAIVSL